jgi:hypothetical protein
MKLYDPNMNDHPTGLFCGECNHLDSYHNNYGVCFVGRLRSMPGDICECQVYNPINIWMKQLWEEFKQHEL